MSKKFKMVESRFGNTNFTADLDDALNSHEEEITSHKNRIEELETMFLAIDAVPEQCGSCGGFCGNGGCDRKNVEAKIFTQSEVNKIVADAERDQWINIEEQLPDKDIKLFYWMIPKPPEECPRNSSGSPICPYGSTPYRHEGKYGTWSSLYKPTDWMLPPGPPHNR